MRTASKWDSTRFFPAAAVTAVKSSGTGFAAPVSSTEDWNICCTRCVFDIRVFSSWSSTVSGLTVALTARRYGLTKSMNVRSWSLFPMRSSGGSHSCSELIQTSPRQKKRRAETARFKQQNPRSRFGRLALSHLVLYEIQGLFNALPHRKEQQRPPLPSESDFKQPRLRRPSSFPFKIRDLTRAQTRPQRV